MKKNILIIGGAGYVGSVITSDFLKDGYSVNVLDNFVYNNQFAITPFFGDSKYKFFFGDFGDEKILKQASQNIDIVLILSGLVGDPITKKYPKKQRFIKYRAYWD